MTDINDFFKFVSESKKETIDKNPGKKALKVLEEDLKNTNPFFQHLGEFDPTQDDDSTYGDEELELVQEEVLTEVPKTLQPETEVIPNIDRFLQTKTPFQQPDPEVVDPNIKAIQKKLKFIEATMGKILSHGPGSGIGVQEANELISAQLGTPSYTVTNVTADYTVLSSDTYIGVNSSNTNVTITLPNTADTGKLLIVKDEEGSANSYPITLSGTVDGDSGGAIIQLNYGSLTLMYNSGWRII